MSKFFSPLASAPRPALQLQAAALVLCYCVDRNFAAADSTPSWLLPLRLILTAGASACLLIASVA